MRSTTDTATYIPYAGDDGEDLELMPDFEHSSNTERALRYQAYLKSWDKCLNRIQDVARSILDPYSDELVDMIEDSEVLPGLPRTELPVVTVTNHAFKGTFLHDVCQRLDFPSVYLHPSDCLNVTAGMRHIVSGFIGDYNTGAKVLPTYDIQLLAAWFKHNGDPNTKLLVVLHDFEAFTPTVMQDIFYICSRHLDRLPLVFITSLSSPIPSYLNIAYPRSTLVHLRIRQLILPAGVDVLNKMLLETFFDDTFELDLNMGPIALQYISDFYMRCEPTLDALITNLQLVHMKHFSTVPLSALLYEAPALDEPSWSNVVDELLTRLIPSTKLTSKQQDKEWKSLTPQKLLKVVDEGRERFRQQMNGVKFAFRLMQTIQDFLRAQGHVGLERWKNQAELSDILVTFLLGKVDRDVKELGRSMKFFDMAQLDLLLPRVCNLLANSGYEEEAEYINGLIEALGEEPERNTSRRFSEWGVRFFETRLGHLEDDPLWEIWYTGQTPFPSETVNPSIRASIMAGLLRPFDFTDTERGDDFTEDEEDELWKLPDTSILFKRYLDSGRMINIYDWYESFRAVLETQKEELSKSTAAAASSVKGKGRRKPSAKGKGKAKAEEPAGGAEQQQTEEEWGLEVQARFIRALHELDYLGFVKHTKRKADHVIRTVFDLGEYE